jgi:hypothetical protein
MNRCLIPLLLALTLGGAAQAQTAQVTTDGQASAATRARSFPKEALRGDMTVKQGQYLQMDDRLTRLTPGARVFDEDNRLVRPIALVNRELTVNYTVDRRGQVTQVWILTAEEKKEKRAGFSVERNFSFESQQTSGTVQTLPAPAN